MTISWGVLIGVALLLLVVIVCRELACWYWKINRIVALLEAIEKKLGQRSEA